MLILGFTVYEAASGIDGGVFLGQNDNDTKGKNVNTSDDVKDSGNKTPLKLFLI